MRITFERDSVCAGDDVLAPNQEVRQVDADVDWEVILNEESLGRYLPSVSGSKTYWSVLCDGRKIADVTHVASAGVVVDLVEPGTAVHSKRVFFRYLKQEAIQE